MSLKWIILVTSVLVTWNVDNSCTVLIPPRASVRFFNAPAVRGAVSLNVVTMARKNFIVQMHNTLRARVAPPAADMQIVTWSNDLAAYAREGARCGLPYRHRNSTMGYGENLGRLWSLQPLTDIVYNLNFSITRWWNESQNYDYQHATCTPGQKCGHYTQMVWATTMHVGCAWTINCPMTINGVLYTYTFLLVCAYEPIGNQRYFDRITQRYKNYRPYTEKTASDSTTTTSTVTNRTATTTTSATSTTTATTTTTTTTTPVTTTTAAMTTTTKTTTTTTGYITTSSTAAGKPLIWTYGGTARGVRCAFPFTFHNTKHNRCIVSVPGETAWCKTTNRKWGYCPPTAMRDEQPCVDKLPICRRLVDKFMDGRCPDASHQRGYLAYMKANCSATCGHCDCPVRACQHGGRRVACMCKCVGGWIGGDCAVCPITKCKNGGAFDASTCSCHCPRPYGGVDCGCTDTKMKFVSRGRRWWRCSLTWLLTKKTCASSFFGPSLRKHCPVSCRSCEHPAFKHRQ